MRLMIVSQNQSKYKLLKHRRKFKLSNVKEKLA